MFHENGKNEKKNIEELNKDNAEHIVEGRNEAKRKSDSRSKKKADKNISLAWVNARNVYDQGRTDGNNIDHFSHGSPQKDFISGKCEETYPDQNMFSHHSIKLHGSDLKLRTEIDDECEHIATIPCKIAEKGVKAKPREKNY